MPALSVPELPRISLRIVRNYFLYAHEIVVQSWARALGATALFSAILTAVHLAAIQLVLFLVHVREEQNILLSVFTLPFTAYCLAGLLQFFVALVREPATARLRLLFLTDLRRYWHMLLFLVYYYFLYVLLVKVVVDFNEYTGLIQIRMIAGLGLFMWLVARLIFAPLYIIAEGLDARAAIKSSYLLTTRRTRRTLLLCVTGLIVLWLGVFALGVGVVYTLAAVVTVSVLLFDNYRNHPDAAGRLQLIEFGLKARQSTKKKSAAPATKKRVVKKPPPSPTE